MGFGRTSLVGGWTNPFGKYAKSNWESHWRSQPFRRVKKGVCEEYALPQIGVKMKNMWNHHPDHMATLLGPRDVQAVKLLVGPTFVKSHDQLKGAT